MGSIDPQTLDNLKKIAEGPAASSHDLKSRILAKAILQLAGEGNPAARQGETSGQSTPGATQGN